jgi:hypothetical protein
LEPKLDEISSSFTSTHVSSSLEKKIFEFIFSYSATAVILLAKLASAYCAGIMQLLLSVMK